MLVEYVPSQTQRSFVNTIRHNKFITWIHIHNEAQNLSRK